MGVDRLCRSYDLLVGGIKLSVADIVFDRACKQEVVLCHDPHLAPKAFDGDVFYVIAVNGDVSLLDVIKPADQVYDGGLAGSGRSYKGDGLAGSDVKAYIMKDLGVLIVGKSHMFKFNVSLDGRDCRYMGSV